MNFSIFNLIRNFFDKYYKYQHPETALRYLPVVDEIKRLKLTKSKILEIGSGSYGITPYLKEKIDGVDIDFSGPQSPLVNQIKGDAANLKFRKNSYDVVISVDVLEHIKPQQRILSIEQMLKIAKRLLVIVVPTGELAQKQDRELNKLWQSIMKEPNQFLAEHVKNGLPTTDQILVGLDKSLKLIGKKARVKSHPLLNLSVRNLLMRTWITKSKIVYYIYLKGFLVLVPILKYANFGNCYRRVFVIELAP